MLSVEKISGELFWYVFGKNQQMIKKNILKKIHFKINTYK